VKLLLAQGYLVSEYLFGLGKSSVRQLGSLNAGS
jgi:hypothetical protein